MKTEQTLDRTDYFRVKLSTRELYEATSLSEAAVICEAYLTAHSMGASDMCRGFGNVTRNGVKVARISYNGRIWANDGTEIK